jgi:mRNA interferase MazF
MEVSQGEIYWVEIREDEIKGSEQSGRRPFIVVSRLAVNRAVKTVVAVPMSTSTGKQHPFRIVIPPTEIAKDVGCTAQLHVSVAKADQVRVIDGSRLQERIGKLSQTATLAVVLGLAYVFDIR